MNTCKALALTGALASLSLLTACGGPTRREVTRVDPGTVVDVDYRFNDTDARQVWQGMVDQATFRGWIDRWMAEHNGQRPIIIVGPVKNNTQDYINTKLFTRNFEREMLNSGRVRIVGAKDDRGDLRDERLQGQEWNSAATRKVMKNELGADLMLIGDINDVQDRSLNGRTTVKYFQVNLDLTDLETSEKAWIGSVEIKKVSNDRCGRTALPSRPPHRSQILLPSTTFIREPSANAKGSLYYAYSEFNDANHILLLSCCGVPRHSVCYSCRTSARHQRHPRPRRPRHRSRPHADPHPVRSGHGAHWPLNLRRRTHVAQDHRRDDLGRCSHPHHPRRT